MSEKKHNMSVRKKTDKISQKYGKALSQSHPDIRPARQSESQTKQIKQMRGICH